jgi:uncharacterized protein
LPVRTAANPRLYDPDSDVPALYGAECGHCGRVYFPPIGIGCEMCGATGDALTPTVLATVGTVYALAEVHLHHGSPPAPFTIAEIVLDAGPLVRAMVHPDAAGLQVGSRVVGSWYVTEVSESGTETVEPAFALDCGEVAL